MLVCTIFILQDLSLIYKHINSICLSIVIVVGGVDSVDRNESPIQVGSSATTQPRCWAFSVKQKPASLWRESGKLIHRLSTGNAVFSSNPHLGEGQNHFPYMGVRGTGHLETRGDFSTGDGTYPQIIATYPQLESLCRGYGGLPCPLNVGAILSNLGRFLERARYLIHKHRFRVAQNWGRTAHVKIEESSYGSELLTDIPYK